MQLREKNNRKYISAQANLRGASPRNEQANGLSRSMGQRAEATQEEGYTKRKRKGHSTHMPSQSPRSIHPPPSATSSSSSSSSLIFGHGLFFPDCFSSSFASDPIDDTCFLVHKLDHRLAFFHSGNPNPAPGFGASPALQRLNSC